MCCILSVDEHISILLWFKSTSFRQEIKILHTHILKGPSISDFKPQTNFVTYSEWKSYTWAYTHTHTPLFELQWGWNGGRITFPSNGKSTELSLLVSHLFTFVYNSHDYGLWIDNWHEVLVTQAFPSYHRPTSLFSNNMGLTLSIKTKWVNIYNCSE